MSLTTTQPTAPGASLRVPFADCEIDPSATRAATRVLSSGWVTTGREVLEFEAEFAEKVGAAYAVAVSSCTAAIELSLRSLRLKPGARVLVSTMTFCGAVQAIIHAGLQPVLVDVDPTTGMPTEETTARAARSSHPAAMVVLHWAGDPADVPALAAAAGLPLDVVVEDAAHALGTVDQGTPVGRGAAVCFSFYATKNLPLGEGGMITTHDEARATWLRRARLHGMSADAWRRYLPGGKWRYDVEDAGIKANLTDVQAAIGRAQLRRLDAWQERRAQVAALYDKRLAGLPGIITPHRPTDGRSAHAWHLYPIRIDTPAMTRDEAMAALSNRGIGTSVHFIPVHQLSYFGRACTTPAGGLPGADVLFEQLLSLPMYPRLTDQQVGAVCDALAESLTRSTNL